MKNQKKMVIIAVMCIAATVFAILLGTSIHRQQSAAGKLTEIEKSKVESIRLSGTTGGVNGNFSHSFSKDEISAFVDLLHKVKLGSTVRSEKALSTGASAYYSITFTDGSELSICPGKYFEVDAKYYEFENMNKLWEEFVCFNSL